MEAIAITTLCPPTCDRFPSANPCSDSEEERTPTPRTVFLEMFDLERSEWSEAMWKSLQSGCSIDGVAPKACKTLKADGCDSAASNAFNDGKSGVIALVDLDTSEDEGPTPLKTVYPCLPHRSMEETQQVMKVVWCSFGAHCDSSNKRLKLDADVVIGASVPTSHEGAPKRTSSFVPHASTTTAVRIPRATPGSKCTAIPRPFKAPELPRTSHQTIMTSPTPCTANSIQRFSCALHAGTKAPIGSKKKTIPRPSCNPFLRARYDNRWFR